MTPPDNVPGLISYGMGTGLHGHTVTGACPGKGNPASILYDGTRKACSGQNNGPHPVDPMHGNPVQARMGPAQILVSAQSNPVIGPVWDLTGHSGHARSNPVWGPAGAAIWATGIPPKMLSDPPLNCIATPRS